MMNAAAEQAPAGLMQTVDAGVANNGMAHACATPQPLQVQNLSHQPHRLHTGNLEWQAQLKLIPCVQTMGPTDSDETRSPGRNG